MADNNTPTNNKKRPLETTSTEPAIPITQEGDRPQKKYYRQRAHCNPLSHNDSFQYPVKPVNMDWTVDHYPNLKSDNDNSPVVPTVLDIGCGFGGLTMALAKLLPATSPVLGMEIRSKVTEYVRLRIAAARKEEGQAYESASVLKTNSMKFLPHFFGASSLEKLFFCFPDPHFKRKNWPRRIVSERLLSEYAYLLKEGGRIYCITDVLELHEWHVKHLEAHPLFRRLDDSVTEQDPCVAAMKIETEEGKKVERMGGQKHYCVYERIPNVQTASVHASNFFSTAASDSDNDNDDDDNEEVQDSAKEEADTQED